MKKTLLLAAAALGSLATMAAEPVFPDELKITSDSKTVVINQEYDDDIEALTVNVAGSTTADNVTLKFDLPEGWDGVVAVDMSGMYGSNRTRAAESEWVPIDSFLENCEGLEVYQGDELTLPVDESKMLSCMLYANDQVDVANGFMMIVNVEKAEAAEPVFPSTLDISSDSKTVVINQEYDDDIEALTVNVAGSTTADNVTLKFNLPEGWDGVVAVDMSGMYGSNRTRAAESEWVPIDSFLENCEGLEVYQGVELTLPVDESKMLSCMLYANDQVDVANGFMMIVNVEKNPNTGVENVAIENGEARYFNLQGIEVINPENGIFVKVAGGKAVKVIK